MGHGQGVQGHQPLPLQAWLTEIQEYAQHNVVLMLLGNKVGGLPCPPHPSPTEQRWGGRWQATGRLSSRPLCPGQVDSAHEHVVKREDGEKLAKVSQGRVGGEEGAPEAVEPGMSPPRQAITRLAAAACRSMGCRSWRPVPRQASTWTWPSRA